MRAISAVLRKAQTERVGEKREDVHGKRRCCCDELYTKFTIGHLAHTAQHRQIAPTISGTYIVRTLNCKVKGLLVLCI